MTYKKIKDVINDLYDVDIASKKRLRFLADLRRVYVLLCIENVKRFSPSACGREINRQHCSILYFEKTGLSFFQLEDPDIMSIYENVKEVLSGKTLNEVANGINTNNMVEIQEAIMWASVIAASLPWPT